MSLIVLLSILSPIILLSIGALLNYKSQRKEYYCHSLYFDGLICKNVIENSNEKSFIRKG